MQMGKGLGMGWRQTRMRAVGAVAVVEAAEAKGAVQAEEAGKALVAVEVAGAV